MYLIVDLKKKIRMIFLKFVQMCYEGSNIFC